ncbi:MAG: methyltransferase domain-containing protein [Acidimicrobiales bacterium]
MDAENGGYLLANAAEGAARRLEVLSEIFDPWTRRHLDHVGLGPGWRCWEVGAGGPSLVAWLAERVGETGLVLATDIDTRALGTWGPPVQVLAHDVATDSPPEGPFDLVHARLVLVHVAERERALANMVSTLRPGGWLVLEEADPALQPLACIDPVTAEEQLANTVRAGFRTLMAGRDVDLAFGRTLPRRLRGAGLTDVGAESYFPVSLPACRDLELATMTVIGPRLVEEGVLSSDDVDRHVANVAAGRLDLAQPPLITAWGRRPDGG